MEDGDFFDVQFLDREVHDGPGLDIVGEDGPVEVRVVTAQGQVGIGGGGGDHDDAGVLVDGQGSLGCPGADMADDDLDALGDEFGRGVGGDFRLADVVFDQQLHLLAVDAAPGVDLLDHQFRGLDRGQTV